MASVPSMQKVSIQVKEPVLGLESSARKGLCRSTQKIWLWIELGCISDVRMSMRSSQQIEGIIVDNNSEGEESG